MKWPIILKYNFISYIAEIPRFQILKVRSGYLIKDLAGQSCHSLKGCVEHVLLTNWMILLRMPIHKMPQSGFSFENSVSVFVTIYAGYTGMLLLQSL
jgi:hypothetical protein